MREIAHIGITVSDMDKSVEFYKNVLGLDYVGEMIMEGETTEKLFRRKGCKARVSYLTASGKNSPLVELICFLDTPSLKVKTDLFRTSISELCFETENIYEDYERLKRQGVEFLSEPQPFDSTKYGFGKSIAVYLYDPDGNILELIEKI